MTTLPPLIALIPGLGSLQGGEIIILAILGILIFGKRLPEVGRSIGRGIVEFKKGLSGVEDDLEAQVRTPPQIESRKAAELNTTQTDTATPSATTTATPTESTPSA